MIFVAPFFFHVEDDNLGRRNLCGLIALDEAFYYFSNFPQEALKLGSFERFLEKVHIC